MPDLLNETDEMIIGDLRREILAMREPAPKPKRKRRTTSAEKQGILPECREIVEYQRIMA